MRISKILVPCDFSRASVVALERAAEMLQPGSTLELLHIVPGPSRPPRTVGAEAASEVAKLDFEDRAGQLQDLVQTVIPARASEVMLSVEFGDAGDRIVERSPHCDLIVVGTSRSPMRGNALGSVSGQVVRNAACSVLVVREHTAREVA